MIFAVVVKNRGGNFESGAAAAAAGGCWLHQSSTNHGVVTPPCARQITRM